MVKIITVPVIDLAELRKLALLYDKKYGCHRESEFEGQAFYDFVHELVTGEQYPERVPGPDYWEREKAWAKECNEVLV